MGQHGVVGLKDSLGPHGNERFCIGPNWHLGRMGTGERVTKEVDTTRNGHRSKRAVGIKGERAECKWYLGKWALASSRHLGKLAPGQNGSEANRRWGK